MPTRLSVLIIENSQADAELLVHELQRGGYELIYERVDTAAAVASALDNLSWDAILSDYSMPSFSALEALKLVQERGLDLSFILVSGTIGVEVAVAALKAGAHDFFGKDQLALVIPALERELRERKERLRRRETEEQLHQSEARFRALVQYSSDVIAILETDGTFRFLSPAVEQALGYPPDELIGKHFLQIIPADDIQRRTDEFAVLLQTPGVVRTLEMRSLHRDGSQRIFEVTFSNLLQEEAIQGIVANVRDITERKRAEEELRQAEERFGKALQDSPIPISIKTLTAERYIDVNSAFLNQFGYRREEVVGHTMTEVGLWADPNAWARVTQRLSEQSTVGDMEIRLLTKSRHVRDVLGSFDVVEIGDELCVLSLFHDITERKQAEAELRAVYNATSYLFKADSLLNLGRQVVAAVVHEFEQGDCGLLLADRSRNKIVSFARSGEYEVDTTQTIDLDDVGLVPNALRTGQIIYAPDVAAEPDYNMSDPRTRSELVIPLKTANRTLGVLDLQSREPDAFSERDQRILNTFAERTAVAIEMMYLNAELNQHAEDLEMRVAQRTAELQRAKEQVEAILNQSSDAIILANSDTAIRQANPAFYHLLGYTTDETLGQAMSELTASHDVAALLEAVEMVIVTREPMRLEVVLRRNDGTMFDADIAIAPVVQLDTDDSRVIFSIRDITERKRAELELRQAWLKEKDLNELKTRFVSMVSHDFRTPLASIQSSSDLLRNYSDRMTDDKKQKHFETIRAQIKHLTALLEDMLTITKAESIGLSFQPMGTDLAVFCQAIADEMQLLAGTRRIKFTINLSGERVKLDPNLLRRALINLLSNAVKYSLEGSVVEFSVLIGDTQIEIRVKDQGIGIPEEDQSRLFEVFHRAKNVGQISGTGLGLAIVKWAVEAHGGTITVQSEVGVGSTVTISLPLIRAEAGTE